MNNNRVVNDTNEHPRKPSPLYEELGPQRSWSAVWTLPVSRLERGPGDGTCHWPSLCWVWVLESVLSGPLSHFSQKFYSISQELFLRFIPISTLFLQIETFLSIWPVKGFLFVSRTDAGFHFVYAMGHLGNYRQRSIHLCSQYHTALKTTVPKSWLK